jgi:glyoxylase-like metal-dependent hydrolase (beta-lactamase superfamily II)
MAAPEFHTLDQVEYGVVEQVSPRVRRVIANNPSKFTYRGTGTYLVGHGDVVVIDPGPRLDSHRDALATALDGARVRAILVTHCHSDHSPLAEWLQAETGAPTIAFGPHPRPDPRLEPRPDPDAAGARDASDEVAIEESTDYDFTPDERVVDGDVAVSGGGLTMRAVHTPGHTSNHMCWTLDEESTLFTGDHVMGWSTTVVSPPDGDMGAYIDSLRRVAARDDAVLWPTHGPSRTDGRRYVEALIDHRLAREAAVLDAVRSGRGTATEIVELLYVDVRKELHKPAARTVWAHLVKLVDDGHVAVAGLATLDATYRPR